MATLESAKAAIEEQQASEPAPEARLSEVGNSIQRAGEVAETKPLSVKEWLGQLKGVFPIDQAVHEALPKGTTFQSVEPFGSSAWTITGQVTALDPDGTESFYFLKVAHGEHGRVMLYGEWESSKMIHTLMPHFIPKPTGFGRLETHDAYFYLAEFVKMDVTTPPDAAAFTERLAEMHRSSQSHTGKFGFHTTTCDGKLAHTVDWEDSWAVFFRKLLLGVCKLELEANGPWPELELATNQVLNKVIPRLLDNLEEHEGVKIKPCLIHGDLWEGNMGIRKDTKETLLFDAGSYFAHNEMELGHWQCKFTSVFRHESYTRHYLTKYREAKPTLEFKDRNRLYRLKGTMNYAAGHPGSGFREIAYNDMCYLCDKYAPIGGIAKYDPGKDPEVTGETIVPHEAEGFLAGRDIRDGKKCNAEERT